MADEKSLKKAKTKTARKGDVKIVIGSKSKPSVEAGIEIWALEGQEKTKEGDRCSVAYLTCADLYKLGWVRRKY